MKAAVRTWWYAAIPALAALVMGLWGLAATGPWFDERYTIAAISDGLASHLSEAPWLPYFATLAVWSGFGAVTDIAWLRLLSVLAVVVAAVVVAVTTRLLGSPRGAMAAGLVLAISPGVARYAQEARAYALALACVSLASLFLVLAMQGRSRRWWIAYTVALIMGVLYFPVTVFVLPAHAVILTSFPGWRSHVRDWIAACLFVSPVVALEVAIAPYFRALYQWLGPPTADSLTTAWAWPIAGYFGSPQMLVFAGALVIASLVTPVGRRWLAGLAVTMMVLLVVSATVMSWWTARSFIPFAGLLCVAAGLAFSRLSWPWLTALLVVLAALTIPAQQDVRSPDSRGVDLREVAAVLRMHAQPGDVLMGDGTMSELGWVHRYYLGGNPDLRVQAAPPGTGRWWMRESITGCVPARVWNLDADGALTLCE